MYFPDEKIWMKYERPTVSIHMQHICFYLSRLKASSICQTVIVIWIKIHFNLMWIRKIQIEHVLANVNKGSRSYTTTTMALFDFVSDKFNTVLLAFLNSGLIIDGRYK